MRYIGALIGLVLYLCGAIVWPVYANDAVKLPDKLRAEGVDLFLNGTGIRKATIFRVEVYTAGLYISQPSANPEAIVNSLTPKMIAMRFTRNVSGADVISAWQKGIDQNSPDAGRFADALRQLTSGLGDIREGEELRVTFLSEAVTLQKPGAIENTVSSGDFSKAVLRIWLGNNPPDEGLKRGLLGIND
jgi:hypothetical protein